MAMTVDAIYENGVLRPAKPLPLREHETVQVTIEPVMSLAQATAGLIPCSDAKLIERVASEPVEEL